MFSTETMRDKDYGVDILDWEDTRPENFPFIKHMIAGSLAGVMEHVGMFPLDTIKTHIQASTTKLGFWSTTRRLYRENGLSRFYSGANVIASGCIPAHACYFSTYEVAKEKFGIEDGETHYFFSGLIGAIATLSHDAFLTPSDWLKQRMQLNNLPAWEWLKKTIKEEGTRALFRSYPVTLMMNMPFAFVMVSANENIKVFVKPREQNNPFVMYFGWAFIAGMISSAFTHPMDVIKTKLQIQHHDSNLDSLHEKQSWGKGGEKVSGEFKIEEAKVLKEAHYKDIRDVASKIYKSEGVRGFYRGTIPRMFYVAPGAALSWGTYEIFKSLLKGGASE